jgi:RNA polymerase sigma-70 factor (ECF subfamily)
VAHLSYCAPANSAETNCRLADTSVVNQANAAAAAGFHQVWEAHSQAVYRFALWLCGNPATADDLTAEAFLRIWTCWDRVECSTVRSYLCATARNLYLQQIRRTGREDPLDFASIDPALPIDAGLAAKQQLALTLQAVRGLPEVDRTALILRVQQELSYSEIAALLGMPEATVRVKIHRARLRLAEHLKEGVIIHHARR